MFFVGSNIVIKGSQQHNSSRKSRRKSHHASLQAPVNERLRDVLNEFSLISHLIPNNDQTKSLLGNLEKLLLEFRSEIDHSSSNVRELSHPVTAAASVYTRQVEDRVSDAQSVSHGHQRSLPDHRLVDSLIPLKRHRIDQSQIGSNNSGLPSACINQPSIMSVDSQRSMSQSYMDVNTSLLPPHRLIANAAGSDQTLVVPLSSGQQFDSINSSHAILDSSQLNTLCVLSDTNYPPSHTNTAAFGLMHDRQYQQYRPCTSGSQSYVQSLPKTPAK